MKGTLRIRLICSYAIVFTNSLLKIPYELRVQVMCSFRYSIVATEKLETVFCFIECNCALFSFTFSAEFTRLSTATFNDYTQINNIVISMVKLSKKQLQNLQIYHGVFNTFCFTLASHLIKRRKLVHYCLLGDN